MDMATPPGLLDRVTWLEAVWTLVAVIGIAFTAGSVWVMGKATWVVNTAIKQRTATRKGPRWRFVLGMLIATAVCFPGWIMFLITGIIAMETPSNSERQETANLFALMILGGEISFAFCQVSLVMVWWLVRRASGFVPSLRLPQKGA